MTAGALDEIGLGQSLIYAGQLVLGVVFATSAWPKVRSPRSFIKTVSNYDIVTPAASRLIAPSLIATEVLLAACLLAGIFVVPALAVACVTLALFGVAVSINLHRGRDISCGCFGADSEKLSAASLMRIAALLAATAALLVTIASGGAAGTAAAELVGEGWGGLRYAIDVAGMATFVLVAGLFANSARDLLRVARMQSRIRSGGYS